MVTKTPVSYKPIIQWVAIILGIVFLTVGILGFIPGITTNFGTLQFAGHQSTAMLFGIFQVSGLHNIVHLIYGVVGLSAMSSALRAFRFLLWGGVLYAILWLYGLFVQFDATANFVPLNTGDNWLHFGLAVVMVASSFIFRLVPTTSRRGISRY